jgi:hypothetical protein
MLVGTLGRAGNTFETLTGAVLPVSHLVSGSGQHDTHYAIALRYKTPARAARPTRAAGWPLSHSRSPGPSDERSSAGPPACCHSAGLAVCRRSASPSASRNSVGPSWLVEDSPDPHPRVLLRSLGPSLFVALPGTEVRLSARPDPRACPLPHSGINALSYPRIQVHPVVSQIPLPARKAFGKVATRFQPLTPRSRLKGS